MQACSLPPTGFDAPVVAVLIVAVALLAAGIVLATARRGRRTVARGLGALVLVGALAAVGVGVAQPANADTGRCATAPTPTPEPTPTPTPEPTATPTPDPLVEVTPDAPTTAAQCGAEPLLTVPEQEGLDFVQQRTGDDLTIVATPLPGYVVTPGAQSVFEIDMTPSPYAPWPVEIPDVVETLAGPGAGPGADGFALIPVDPALVPALQAAQEAAALEYAIDGSAFAFDFTVDIYPADGGAPIAVPVSVPVQASFLYDFARGAYVLRWTFPDEDAAFIAAYIQQLELQQQYGESAQAILRDTYALGGLALSASYVPGPLCDAVEAEAPITIDATGGEPGAGLDGLVDRVNAILAADAGAATAAPDTGTTDAEARTTDDAALDVLPAETR